MEGPLGERDHRISGVTLVGFPGSNGRSSLQTIAPTDTIAESIQPGEQDSLMSKERRDDNYVDRFPRLFDSGQPFRYKIPLLTVLYFLIGLGMAIAHCIFYPGLKGMVVGTPVRQETKIR